MSHFFIFELGGFFIGGWMVWELSNRVFLKAVREFIYWNINQSMGWLSRDKIKNQWPQALELMAGGLTSGDNLMEALLLLIQEAPDPLGSHLRRKLGGDPKWIPTRICIETCFSEPFLAYPRAVLLMSEGVGGHRAHLLETSARLLRERIQMDQKVKTLTVQGRLSAWVVGLSPFILMASLSFLAPELMDPFFSSRLGKILLVWVCISVVLGLVLVHRMVRVEP